MHSHAFNWSGFIKRVILMLITCSIEIEWYSLCPYSFLKYSFIFLGSFSISFISFGFNSPFYLDRRNLHPLHLNTFLTVLLKTLSSTPETNRSLLIANYPNSSLNLRISLEIILYSFVILFCSSFIKFAFIKNLLWVHWFGSMPMQAWSWILRLAP